MNNAETDLIIDETNLARASLDTSRIYGRYLRIRSEESVRLNLLKNQMKELLLEKRIYYSGKASPEVYREKPFNFKLIKSEVNEYVESDSEVTRLEAKIDIQTEKLSYLNDLLKMISGRQFQIRAAIDYQKLIAGGY